MCIAKNLFNKISYLAVQMIHVHTRRLYMVFSVRSFTKSKHNRKTRTHMTELRVGHQDT